MRNIFRKPSLGRMAGAYKGQWKRQMKRALIPWYGKRGMGLAHPKRALYNRMYYRTSIGISPSQLRRRTNHRRRYTYKRPRAEYHAQQYRVCPNCGKKIPLYYNFCSSCGHHFN